VIARSIPLFAIVGALALTIATARAEPTVTAAPSYLFAIRVHVEVIRGAPISDLAWARSQVELASGLFAGADVAFVFTEIVPHLGPIAIGSAADCAALAPQMDAEQIDAFVVDHLRGWDIAGVTTGGARRCIALAADAPVEVLAHELGHYFGLDHRANTLMEPVAGGNIILETRQLATIRASARRFALSRTPAAPMCAS
jgi:hypothetical protein